MTLVKTKRRTTGNMRRVRGEHHRRDHKYTKTYWPYIPIVLILGGSAIAANYLPTSSGIYTSRAGAAIGSTSSSLLAGLYIVLIALVAWYAIRHFKRIKTLIVGGEHVLAKHYVLDVFMGIAIGVLYIFVR